MSESKVLKTKEAHEHAELGHADKTLAPVSLTMAILAVSVAAISLLSHRSHNEVLLAQTQANFQKAELVGKRTQQHADLVLIETLGVLNTQNAAQASTLSDKLNREMGRYEIELAHVTSEERRLEEESHLARRKANRLDIGELFCEMALVLCSIALLTRQRRFWFAGIVAAVAGFVMAVTAFWII